MTAIAKHSNQYLKTILTIREMGQAADMLEKPIISVLDGQALHPPPVWMMRQAGRYLPEYRALREQAGSFLDLCFNPSLASEVTLQPVKRFGFDAAILFSDILVIPLALGQNVTFAAGEGPRLPPITDAAGIAALHHHLDHTVLEPVYETVRLVKSRLPSGVALLGFCGAPWTVATYMIAGQGTDDQLPARNFAYQEPKVFSGLIERLIEASIDYLVRQLKAGAEAVQLFDTWAGILPPEEFRRWCVEPAARIVSGVRAAVPGARIIGFPRGVGALIADYIDRVPVNGIGLDWTADRRFVTRLVGNRIALQGNLDPIVLLAGGEAMDRAIDAILADFDGTRFIFNLGHGILPPTPIAHVERMLTRVRTRS